MGLNDPPAGYEPSLARAGRWDAPTALAILHQRRGDAERPYSPSGQKLATDILVTARTRAIGLHGEVRRLRSYHMECATG